jgi:hypothetical protein
MSDPRKIHLADQLGADLRLTAKMLGEYRAELVAQGFPPHEIQSLVEHCARVLLPEGWYIEESGPQGIVLDVFDEEPPDP